MQWVGRKLQGFFGRKGGTRGVGMRVSNWGMFLLALYLILVGINTLGVYLLGQVTGIVALVAGILLLMEHWRR